MKYMGSKNRISKHILPIILKDRKEGQCYVEPFVGGANLIDKVDGLRIGSDFNKHVIMGLSMIQQRIDRIPVNKKEFTEEMYQELKTVSKESYSPLIGFAGFAYSYSGKWFGGWCRDGAGKRDYVAEAYRNAVRQSPNIQGVELICSSYEFLDIPPNSIIYCDPPYKDTTKYSNPFNHDNFYEWCRKMANDGHSVYVSEYNMPNDFECIWSKEIVSSLTKDTGSKKAIEKLFKISNNIQNT